MAISRFTVEAMIRGYHEYKSVWLNPVIVEEFSCEQEIGNARDTHAVVVRKIIDGETQTVGHVPRKISAICSTFIRRGGSILCIVKGNHRYSSDLPQGGLEIPCTLEFVSHDEKETTKAERLLESALGIKSKNVLKERKENALRVSVAVPPSRNLSPKDVVDLLADDEVQSPPTKKPKLDDERIVPPRKFLAEDVVDLLTDDERVEVQSPPTKKPKLDYERIIMGQELSNIEINYAQQLLKTHHPKFNGFQSTLVMRKVGWLENNIQIVHCTSRHHWVMTTTVNCMQGEVKVFDSTFFNCDKETLQTVYTLYQHASERLTITMCHCQKQAGGTDCGLFSIAFATALVHGMNPENFKFCQEKMRPHLVDCFNKQMMVPFP